jgi:hypothetical protein
MDNLGPSEDDEDFGEIRVPEEWEAGVYANASTVTFTPDDFTIDLIHLTLNLVSQLRLWAETVISEGGGNGNGLPL